MPAAECCECGKTTGYRNSRGTRIADIACRHCGKVGTLRRPATGNYRSTAGQRYETCVLCGRRRLARNLAHPQGRWQPKWVLSERLRDFFEGPCCRSHEPALFPEVLLTRYRDQRHFRDEHRHFGNDVRVEIHEREMALIKTALEAEGLWCERLNWEENDAATA